MTSHTLSSHKNTLNPEQILFSLQALLASSDFALQAKRLSSSIAKQLKEQSSVVREKITTPLEAARELQKMIASFNHHLLDGSQYPSFSIEYTEDLVKENIMAFEFFLTVALFAQKIPLEKEEPLFSAAILLWRDVGPKFSPREGMALLANLILKTNALLSEKERFPVPDDSRY